MVNRREFFGGVIASVAGILGLKLPKAKAEWVGLVWYLRHHNGSLVGESQPANQNFDRETFAKNCPGFLVFLDEKEAKRLINLRA